MTRLGAIAAIAAVLAAPRGVAAQERRLDAGGQVVFAKVDGFEENDTGVGARVAWRLLPLVGVEAEMNVFLSRFTQEGPGGGTGPRAGANRPDLSASRLEALFGVTAGPRIGNIRPFAKLRPGVLRYREAPEPIVCIAIFPPPLACQIAAGRSLFALDLGGGIDVDIGSRMLFRVDVADRMVKYPDPYDVGHDLRVSTGWAVRF